MCDGSEGRTRTLNLEIILSGRSTRSSLSALKIERWLVGVAVETIEVMTTTKSSWFQGLRR